MASNVHKEPLRRTDDIANEIIISDINNGEPIDMRDDQLFSQVPLRTDNEDDIETLPQSSVERIMQLQMKQMQFMQSLTKQFSSHIGHSNINFDVCDVTTQHTQGTKRCRSHDNEGDNSSDKHYKGDVESEIDYLDNMLSNIESGENLVKCNEPEPVDMQEVNESMNEMSEFYDESEETSDPIEERLAKTINTSLRANISNQSSKKLSQNSKGHKIVKI